MSSQTAVRGGGGGSGGWLPKDAYDPGGKAAAELNGVAPEAAETLDLALAAAFTSMSLRDRWRDPVVDADLVLTVEALVERRKHQ